MEIEQGQAFQMLPPSKDCCQVCAVQHDEELPHNRDSLFYQFRFAAQWGRSPTWTDAMTHCTPEMQQQYRASLRQLMSEHGMPIPSDLID